MRKIYSTILSLLLVLVVAFSTLTGCNLITVDTERDRNQVVATVSIGDGAPTETIYKKDMIMSYLSYYYVYEQSYGYSRSQVFNLIIDNLINNRVLIQYAIKNYADKAGLTDFDWDAKDFISEEDQEDALYLTYKDVNDLIDSYTVKDEEEKLGDTLTSPDRVVPTGATNKVEEEKHKEIIIDGEEGRKAFAKVINLIKENDMLGDSYVANDITTTEYFNETLKGYYEEKLIERFKKDIQDQARAKVTYEKLQQEYEELYNAQKDYDNTEFVNLLDNLSLTSPVVYSKYNGYGIAYNLLLGASEELKAELNEWKEKNPNADDAEYKAKREEIFSKITVKDLRSSWINRGYDFDAETKKFTGDYTLTEESNSLAFVGDVVELTPAGAKEKEYRATATEMTLDEFIPYMEEYVYGTAKGGAIADNRKVDATTAQSEYINRVRELMFAFSTDDSDAALNIHKGYVVKPIPDGANQEEYQIEYAVAGRELINMGECSYIMVATDFGYHVMFFSEKIDATYDYPTLESYLNKEYGQKTDAEWKEFYNDIMSNWEDYEDSDNYLFLLLDSLASEAVEKAFTKEQTQILNEFVYSGNDYVIKYEDRYADLLA